MKLNTNRAFTIFEVLVASVVVSVLMLGVITASISLSNSARYYSASYYVSQTTQSTLNHILTQAALAIGSPTQPGIVGLTTFNVKDGNNLIPPNGDARSNRIPLDGDPGTEDIINPLPASFPANPTEYNTFCIHQNLNPSDGLNPLSEAYDTNKHRWLCYTFISNKIHWCLQNYDLNNPPGSPGYSSNRPMACTSSDVYLGALNARPITEFSINSGNLTQKVIFKVSITNCLNPGASNCNPASPSSDNPVVVKTGSVSPAGHSS